MRKCKFISRTVGFLSVSITFVACGGSTEPSSFSAQYNLAAVQPTQGVPVSGNGGKNVLIGCMEARADGTLLQAVVYSVAATGVLSIETTTWAYHIDAGEIVVTDPNGIFEGVTSIGSTVDTQISTYRILQNDGMPVTRTLVFAKVVALGSPCGSAAWRGF